MNKPVSEKVSSDPAFQELFRRGRRRLLAKDETVLAEGETPRTLFLIMSGSVSVRLCNWHGQDVLLAYMHAGDFFGEMGLFPGVHARSAMVRTLTECLVLEIPYEMFVQLASQHPSLWLELAGQLGARLRATNRRLAELPSIPVAERVWSVVVELAERQRLNGDAGALIRITREDLGKLAGCSRELAGSALQDFAKDGRVVLQGHRIFVPFPDTGSANGAAA